MRSCLCLLAVVACADQETGPSKELIALEEEIKALRQEKELVAEREKTIENLTDTVTKLKSDLKESVMKTNELREELQDRAAENIRSEVKLRDVETELSIARASTDLISTGVLDYTEDEEENPSTVVK